MGNTLPYIRIMFSVEPTGMNWSRSVGLSLWVLLSQEPAYGVDKALAVLKGQHNP